MSPTARSSDAHVVAIGSIGRFVKPGSIVIGTGVSDASIILERNARYVSVRGPITAKTLTRSGGPSVESFGDPGALIAWILPMDDRTTTNGRLALVRHHTHAKVPLMLPEDVTELSILMSHPDAIRTFVERIHDFDGVITSAMHVMILCHSYGIPCALVGFDGFQDTVHGTGVKYEDYSVGVSLDRVHSPQVLPTNLRREDLRTRLSVERISGPKLDEIEHAVRTGIVEYLDRQAASADRH